MMSKTFWIFAATLAVLCAGEETAVETVKDDVSKAVDMFKDDVTKAAEKVKEFGEHISKMLGLDNLPEANQVVDIIKTQAKNFADQAEQVQKQLELELKKVTNSSIVEGFSEFNKKVLETVSNLRTQIENSAATEKALELQNKFQEGVTSLFEETKKIALTLEPQVVEVGSELQKLTKKVLTDAVDNLDQLQGKIHSATGHTAHQAATSQAATP